jgi:hypothetical protein
MATIPPTIHKTIIAKTEGNPATCNPKLVNTPVPIILEITIDIAENKPSLCADKFIYLVNEIKSPVK